MDISPTSQTLWHCNWNWCPKTFLHGRDLRDHLEQEHFSNILTVRKSEWSAHIRACDGKSGGTESLAGLSLSCISPDKTQQLDSRTSRSPTTPPPELPSTPSPSPSRRRSHSSFAYFAAQSSPMTSPITASLPPSPALTILIADAVNARNYAGHDNASLKPSSAASTRRSVPLPRRRALRSSRSPEPFLPFFSTHRTSLDSSCSAQEIETQLTRSPEISPPHSQQRSEAHEPIPDLLYPTQSPYHAQTSSSSVPLEGVSNVAPTPSFSSGTMHIGGSDADGMQVDDDHGMSSLSDRLQPSSQSQVRPGPGSESQLQANGYGYSPYTNPLVLQTQAPYRSQSQSQ